MQPNQSQVYQQPVHQMPQQPGDVHHYVEVVETEEEPVRESVPDYIHHQTRDLVNIGHELASKLFDNESSTSQTKMKKVAPLLGLLSFSSYKLVFNSLMMNYINFYGVQKFFTGNYWKFSNKDGLPLVTGLGLISAFASGYFISKAASELKQLQKEKSNLRELKGEWSYNQTYPAYNTGYRTSVDRVVEKTEIALDNLIDKKVQEIVYLTLGLIAEGVVLAGTFTGTAVLIAAGSALCTTVALASLLHLGYNYMKNQNEIDAEDLEQELMDVESRGISTY
jgi:hypothetical protein